MQTIKNEQTSAGRVVNSSILEDAEAPFKEKFGAKWIEYRRNWNRASKMEYTPDFPLFVRFETKFRCNMRCKMCVHGHKELEKGYSYDGELDFQTYSGLIDECAAHNCPSIGMNHANEPLLDKDLIERINYAAEKGIMDIHLNTNAMLLTEEMSRELLNSGLTRMCFSLDALTRETFEKIRIGGDFDRIMNNINTFLRLRSEMKKRIPLTRVSMVLQEDNIHEAEDFKKYWVNKVDYVALQRFVPISPFEEDDTDKMAHAKDESPINGKQKCSYAFESVFIHGDGLVLPCAAHKARKIAIGNIHKNSIYDIWHSEAMENIRNCHKKDNISSLKLCPSCFN